MELNWLGLFLAAVLGSAPGTPAGSLGANAALWDVIGGRLLQAGVVLSVLGTLTLLVGLRPTRQSGGAAE